MALILITIIFIINKNVFAFHYASNATSTFSFSAFMFQVYKCACVVKFHVAQLMNILMKMASNSRSKLCSRWDSLLS